MDRGHGSIDTAGHSRKFKSVKVKDKKADDLVQVITVKDSSNQIKTSQWNIRARMLQFAEILS